jgi:hypothetical protein
MLNLFKPRVHEFTSPESSSVVLHNLGLQVGKQKSPMSSSSSELFSGEVNSSDGSFNLQSQRPSTNYNSRLVQADGSVEKSREGSLIKLTLKLSKFGLYFVIGAVLLLCGSAVVYLIASPIMEADASSLYIVLNILGAVAFVLIMTFVLSFAIRYEYNVLESDVRKQSGAEVAV